VELRLDLPVGHDTIPFEDIQGFVRLAELGGAAPSDLVIGVNPHIGARPGNDGSHDTSGGPEALCLEVHTPAEWTPYITIDRHLGTRTLRLLLSLRDATSHTDTGTDVDVGADAVAKNRQAELIEITNELLQALTE
jgi:hypothetical protein